MSVHAAVAARATKSGTSTRVENIVDELLIAVEQVVDADGVEALGLAEMAPEQRLVVAFELDPAARGRLQLQHLADLEIGDLAEVEIAFLEDGADGHAGALDLLAHLLGPVGIAGIRLAGYDPGQRLAERRQRRLGYDHEHLPAAIDRLEEELRRDGEVVAPADDGEIHAGFRALELELRLGDQRERGLQCLGDLVEDGMGNADLDVGEA